MQLWHLLARRLPERHMLGQARHPFGLTPMILQIRLIGSMPLFLAMNAKLLCFVPQKNWVAFFTPPSPPEAYGSLSPARGSLVQDLIGQWVSGLRRSCRIQRFSVGKPMPKSAAICLHGSPLVSAKRTDSERNSSVGRDAICVLLCATIRGQRSGTIPRPVHIRVGAASIQTLPNQSLFTQALSS